MVSRILILIALLCGSVAFSQEESALKFNQVLIVDITTEQVVPQGKVWKVISFQRPTASYSVDSFIRINGSGVYLSAGNNPVAYSLPLWLPSGTVVISGDSANRINVIEFNTN